MSLRGHLLVATARMADPNFTRTVILMLQHDESGAFGVILNRPTDQSIQEIWKQARGAACRALHAVHQGGPVPGPLVALHGEPDLGEVEVIPGIWCSMSGDRLAELVERAPDAMLLFAGYSGWGAGQLEGEMQAGAWLTTEALPSDVFPPLPDVLWTTAHRRAAGMHDWQRPTADDDPRRN